jgi:hypothetical protein
LAFSINSESEVLGAKKIFPIKLNSFIGFILFTNLTLYKYQMSIYSKLLYVSKSRI